MKLCHRCGREAQLLSELQRTDSCPALTQPGLGGARPEQDRARAAFDSLFKKK